MSAKTPGMVFEEPPYWKGSRYPDSFFRGRRLSVLFTLRNHKLEEVYEAFVTHVDKRTPRVRLYIPHFDKEAWCVWANGKYNHSPMAGKWKMRTVKGTPRACDWRVIV
jgi:hypothetical protein